VRANRAHDPREPGRHGDGGCGSSDLERAERPANPLRERDRPAERLERRGAQRGREPGQLDLKLSTARAAREMRVEPGAFELGELAVERKRDELARSPALKVQLLHHSHIESDGFALLLLANCGKNLLESIGHHTDQD
jgi:hypothetical protein